MLTAIECTSFDKIMCPSMVFSTDLIEIYQECIASSCLENMKMEKNFLRRILLVRHSMFGNFSNKYDSI